MEIKIVDVMTPSPAQTQNNILGTVAVEILADDGSVIVRLNGLTVRKAKDGTKFLAMPSFQVGKEGNEKWLNHFKLFPGNNDESDLSKKQRARMDKVATDAIRILENGGTRQRNTGAPASAKAPVAAGKKKEPWDV